MLLSGSIAPPPVKITIETTSVCNLRCVMCPHAIGAVHRPKHFDDELVAKVAPLLAGCRHLELHGIGEPLLSPAFWKMLRAMDDGGFAGTAVVNSNAVVLTDRMVANLAASKLHAINISLDAATPATYRRIRGEDFDRVVGNVRRLAAALRARPGKRPELQMNMTLMRENLHELPAFVDLVQDVGADLAVAWPINDYGPDEPLTRDWVVRRDGWSFVYREQVLDESMAVGAVLRAAREAAQARGVRLVFGNLPAWAT